MVLVWNQAIYDEYREIAFRLAEHYESTGITPNEMIEENIRAAFFLLQSGVRRGLVFALLPVVRYMQQSKTRESSRWSSNVVATVCTT